MRNSKKLLGVAVWICLLMLNLSSATAQTFNLHTIEPDAIPVGSTLEWHSALPVSSGNLVANAAAVNPGIYYAVYKKGTCYSNPSPFKIVKTDCGSNFTDLYKSVDTANKPSGTVVTFHTAKPVDLSNQYSGNAHVTPVGTYYVAYYDPIKACFTTGTPIKVIPNLVCATNPDFNVTHINVPVNGNVSTNDNVPTGTTYGTPIAGNNPSPVIPVMNPDGSYSFTPTDTGVYTFQVPVCSPDTTIGCVNETLTITVTNPYINNNPPIVNPDVASVDSGSTVTIPVLDNDQPGNPGGHLGTPVPSDPPHGTVAVTPDGDIVYTPDPGFTGVDTFTYTVCDTSANPDLCKSTTVTVNVASLPSPNTIFASDDFEKVSMNTTASGNVTSNDMDPDGDPMKVTAQNITIVGVGTFVLDSLGNYTFTPVDTFFGPVQFPYTVCDTAGHCASATLHILVDPVNILNPDFNVTHVNVEVGGNMGNNDELVPGTNFGTPIAGNNPSPGVPQMQTDGTYTFTPTQPGVYVFEVPVCAPNQPAPCPTETLTITVTNPYNPGSNPPVVNPDNGVVDSGSTVTIPVLDNDQPGNPGGSFGPPTATDPPHGTVVVTPGGDVVYTPDPGFTGVDTFTYTVCDTTATPDLCSSTTVTVTVNPPGAANTILANDDYVNIDMNTIASGNVMSNDMDPDDDPLTVTPQNTAIAGVGTFVVDASGNYTFTPTGTFYGPVQIPYNVCDNQGNCDTAVLHVLVDPVNILEPDFNVTNINTQVTGNMSTNDELVSGSTFGTPVANMGNPTNDLPILNSNGSYSFTPDTAGVYVFQVPVCAPNQSAPCPIETLTITVLNPASTVFPPVVNPDNGTGKADSTITINITGNDDPTSPGGSFGTPTITIPPSNGTVVTNPDGTVDYTPNPGFTGTDTFTYTICDTVPTPDQCGSATVTVHVLPPDAVNSVAAHDDYVNTYGTVPATGNVLLNDNDPEGGIMTVTPQNITTSAGTFVLQSNGNYTFTPAAGFTGATSFAYNVCDNGEPQACDLATLHILVDKAPDYTPLIFGSNFLFSNSDTVKNYIVAIYNVNNTINKGPVKFRISQSLPNKELIIDPAMTIINYNGNPVAVGNSDWNIVLNGSFYEFTLKPNVIIPPNGSKYIGIKVKVPEPAPAQIQPVTVNIIYQSGGDSNYSNNSYSITITKN